MIFLKSGDSMKMKLLCAPRGPLSGSEAALSLLRYGVRETCGIELPRIEKSPLGKPFFPERPDIFFSLSHTKTHVLAAVSGTPVGVDVETRRPVLPGVPGRVCAPEELLQFDFFELWVLKESFVKVSGNSRVDPRSIRFGRDGERIVTPDVSVRARLFTTVPGCAAAVCAEGGGIPDELGMAELSKILRNS
jgi:phosphopantetheinyl transferase